MVPSGPVGSSVGSEGVWSSSSMKRLDEQTEGGRRQREQELKVTRTRRWERNWRQGPPAGLWVDTPKDMVTFIGSNIKTRQSVSGDRGAEGGSHPAVFQNNIRLSEQYSFPPSFLLPFEIHAIGVQPQSVR